jgi:hypothetical protein
MIDIFATKPDDQVDSTIDMGQSPAPYPLVTGSAGQVVCSNLQLGFHKRSI